MPTAEGAVQLLARVPVFAALGPDDLSEIAAVAIPRRFAANEIIFREGDTSDTCYVVRTGTVRAVRHNPDGRSITLAHFDVGDIFGELAMFDAERRSATVECVDDVEAIAITADDMRRLMRAHPEISMKLVVALGRRLREVNERLSRQSFQTVQSRVASVLAELVQRAVRESPHPADRVSDGILLVVTQADVSQLAGSSRESASRFLAVLERAGIVSQGRGKITVHDVEALQRYVY